MLFGEMMAALINENPGYSFDSVTEEIISDDEDKKDECITLTWHGCDIKIRYDGTIEGFLRNAHSWLNRFDKEKYAEELEKEKGLDRDTAIETASELNRMLLYDLWPMEDDKVGLKEQKSRDQNKDGYLYIETDENGNAAVGFGGESDMKRHRVPAYVRIYGKRPTKEELSVFFGNLNGKPVNEAMKILKAFADMTINTYCETDEYKKIETEAGQNGP